MDLKNEFFNDTQPETMGVDKLAYVNSWFLMGSPVPVALILASYLLFVTKLGPDFMKNREPFQLKNTLFVYNIIQVAISCGLFRMCCNIIAKHGVLPQTCVMETDAQRLLITSSTYIYLLVKITELLDTVFFVLRKKDNQVTFLHVYHHSLMVFITWVVLKYEPRYVFTFLGIFNSFVHVLMYTYYGLSSFPSLAKYLWWKKYITTIQLIQFLAIFIHYCIYHMMSDCLPSHMLSFHMAFNLILFLYMFGKFYVNTYTKKDNAEDKKKDKAEVKNGDTKATSKRTGKDTKAGDKVNGNNGVGKKTAEYTFESSFVNRNKTFNKKYDSIGNR